MSESERVRDWEKRTLTPVQRWARMRIRSLRHIAKSSGISFNIEVNDLVIRFEICQGKCEFCGFTFTLETGDRNQSPEIDRIFPHVGYVPKNIQLLCRQDNRRKADMTSVDIAQLLQWQLIAERDVNLRGSLKSPGEGQLNEFNY